MALDPPARWVPIVLQGMLQALELVQDFLWEPMDGDKSPPLVGASGKTVSTELQAQL